MAWSLRAFDWTTDAAKLTLLLCCRSGAVVIAGGLVLRDQFIFGGINFCG